MSGSREAQEAFTTRVESIAMQWQHHAKPPNEVWVEVMSGNTAIEAMAFFGRDGWRPHWQLRDGSSCSPGVFTTWRHLPSA